MMHFLHDLRRTWRGLNPFAQRAAAQFFYHERYVLDLDHPVVDSKRALRILSFLESENLLHRGDLQQARAISLARLRHVHADRYLASLQDPGKLRAVLGYEIPPRLQDDLLRTHRTMVDGTVRAACLAADRGGVVINLGGGFHHARADAGEGFCFFNDIAMAVDELRRNGRDRRVLVIDLDLHDGDGTRALFARDPDVHTFSIHNRDLASTAAVASTSIALGNDVEDGLYLETLRATLPGLLQAFRPELVFYLAGCDPADDDKLGNWRISSAGMLERDLYVMAQLQACPGSPPVVILLGGGYGRGAWRYSARFFARLLSSDSSLEPPATLPLPLAQDRYYLRLLANPPIAAEPKEESWALTEEDLGQIGLAQPRFLGAFSRHGIEMALERSGLLDRLRARGFRELKVEVEVSDPMGHTLRILSGRDAPQVLVELRLRRDRAALAGHDLLSVEWLRLQDVGTPFRAQRPLLPGQEHPGLGLLQDVAALLILGTERLGLDGLTFVSEHYHLAAQASPQTHFMDPREEARFQAVQRALRGLSLHEASTAVAEGRVVDRRTGEPYRWRPARLVRPVSPDLTRRFESEIRRRAVAAATTDYDFKLLPSPPK
jgi:acetoin utilization deacetylase AcuC-like enzyme